VKAFCLEKGLTRGRTNHNLGKRVKYLVCKELGCNAKTRVVQYMEANVYKLETASEHNHNVQQAPKRGLSNDQKKSSWNATPGIVVHQRRYKLFTATSVETNNLLLELIHFL
jgi:hypothetical protein